MSDPSGARVDPGEERTRNDDELESIRARLREEIMRGQVTGTSPPSGPPAELTGRAFDRFLADHERVVIDVWAPWCGPCRAFSPTLDAIAASIGPAVAFGKVISDADPAIAARFGVTGIPTVLTFRRGALVDRFAGAYPRNVVEPRLRRVLELPPT